MLYWSFFNGPGEGAVHGWDVWGEGVTYSGQQRVKYPTYRRSRCRLPCARRWGPLRRPAPARRPGRRRSCDRPRCHRCRWTICCDEKSSATSQREEKYRQRFDARLNGTAARDLLDKTQSEPNHECATLRLGSPRLRQVKLRALNRARVGDPTKGGTIDLPNFSEWWHTTRPDLRGDHVTYLWFWKAGRCTESSQLTSPSSGAIVEPTSPNIPESLYSMFSKSLSLPDTSLKQKHKV